MAEAVDHGAKRLRAQAVVLPLPQVQSLPERALGFIEPIRFDASGGVKRPEPRVGLGEQCCFAQSHQSLSPFTAQLGAPGPR